MLRSILWLTSFLLFSCNNDEDSENSVYSSQYNRHIIYTDSVSNFEDDGIVRVTKKNNLFQFDFEVKNGKIESIKEIELEMTGANTLRNVGWTPSKLIMMSKDSLNIMYRDNSKIWIVNGLKHDTIK